MNLAIEWVDSNGQLQSLCDRLQQCEFIALDTEFLREKTYYPQLCLIQVATTDILACIDPLASLDLSPFLALLTDKRILKVFHAAGQDLEILYQLNGVLPTPVFDSQIAAAMLGVGEQVSYAQMIQATLHIALEKTQSRTDWAKRPLSDAQIQYAADDVRYLVDAYLKQHEILQASGRLAWLQDDFARLSNPDQFTFTADDLLKRVKGKQQLKPRQLAIARNLAAWRESEAKRKNKPRKWMMSDQVIVDLARRPPTSLESLNDYRGLHQGQIKHAGKQILKAVQDALALAENDLPAVQKHLKLNQSQAILADSIMALLRLLGHEHGIAPNILGSKRQVDALVSGDRQVAMLQGWRNELCGRQISSFLAGKASLSVDSGQLQFFMTNDE